MANFVANSQFSINAIDLNFYIDNVTGGNLEEDSDLNFFGTTYTDHFYVTADNGVDNLRFDIFGKDFAVSLFGSVTAGTINAVGEFDVDAGSYRWYATGFSADAVSTYNAATSASTADDIAVIQSELGGADTISLSAFNDTMNGYGGDDTMRGGGGNDNLDGGTGSDTAILDSSFAQATISFDGNVLVISSATDGTDHLSNFEFVNFAGDVRSVVSLMPANDPPIPVPATASAVEDGAVVTGQLQASDANGDPISFSVLNNTVAGLTISQSGGYSFNPSNLAYQSLKAGQTQQFIASFSVSDGKVAANSTLAITVTGVNDLPSFEVAERSLSTAKGVAVNFGVAASDFDGDSLNYVPSAAVHGSITPGTPGNFTYTPTAGYAGTDTFTVSASDGHGGSAVQTFTVTISAPNANPVIASTGLQVSVSAGTPKTFTVIASDLDGDPLTFSAADPLHGVIAIGTGGQLTYTPDNGFTGSDSVVVIVSDGRGGSATQTYAMIVSSGNLPPLITSTGLVLITPLNTAKTFTISASDPNGDTLTFTAADPAHGRVTGGTNGQFSYTPDSNFIGVDSFDVTVLDGKGGSDIETFTATVTAGTVPADRLFSLLSDSGFTGSIGGFGNIFGTTASESITVFNRSGALAFDPSFNKGGDVIHLSGVAADWQISRSGSTAILTNGGSFLEIPVGTIGIAMAFDDGARLLRINTQLGSLTIGSQPFAEDWTQITAPSQNLTLPTGLDPKASASVILQSDGEVIAGGVLDIFGTATDHETVELVFGDGTFDPSFNKGGDLIVLRTPAEEVEAKVVGSQVILDSSAVRASIPAGIVGVDINFDLDDIRLMLIKQSVGAILLGAQQLGIDPIMLAAAS